MIPDSIAKRKAKRFPVSIETRSRKAARVIQTIVAKILKSEVINNA
jgi:hypothetical protein